MPRGAVKFGLQSPQTLGVPSVWCKPFGLGLESSSSKNYFPRLGCIFGGIYLIKLEHITLKVKFMAQATRTERSAKETKEIKEVKENTSNIEPEDRALP